jgi:hypothetical protein
MNKGTILSIDRTYAYVFTQDCRMVRIRWLPGMTIGKEIPITMNHQNDRLRTEAVARPARRAYWKPAMAAALLIVLIAATLLYSQGILFSPVYARLSIDVNPSVQFDLNRQLEIIKVRTLNAEAAQVLAGEDLIGLPWQDAVDRWAGLLRERFSEQIQTMLISAVIPDQAVQLLEQLANLEQMHNAGELAGLQIRVIYSKDPAVVRTAQQNGLSIGRQMLLNQAEEQHQNYDAASIAGAPLGTLIQSLLQAGQPDQTGLTRKTTQSLSDPSGTTNNQGNGATSQQTNQQSGQHTNQETNEEQNGQTQPGSSQPTNQETNQEQNGQTNGATQCTANGVPAGSTQSASETNGNNSGSGSYGIGSTSCTSSCATSYSSISTGDTLQSTLRQTDCSTLASGR